MCFACSHFHHRHHPRAGTLAPWPSGIKRKLGNGTGTVQGGHVWVYRRNRASRLLGHLRKSVKDIYLSLSHREVMPHRPLDNPSPVDYGLLSGSVSHPMAVRGCRMKFMDGMETDGNQARMEGG